MDTAGSNSPIVKALTEESALVQKRSIEMFLQNLSFSLTDITIVVVNELTSLEQEFVKGIIFIIFM